MKENHLAIASIPMQSLKNPYTPDKALVHGTVFPNLFYPFFAASSELMEEAPASSAYPGCCPKVQEKMKQLTEVSFVLDDLNLYLDTHPDDNQAFDLYKKYGLTRSQLLKDLSFDGSPVCCGHIEKIEDRKNAPAAWKGGN
ncbi:MAG: spore coat protein CotJB [Lachnospiraceae bacterium]|nr:spore coat protein CotJB [Lachnospiraceae bacterium]